MKKELGPMAKLHGGPDNKAIGGLNSTGPEAMSEISKNIPPKSDTIRVSRKYKPGDFVEEYELEKEIKKQTGAFPQLSVQDYSKVEVDDKGRNIVVKKGPQATDPDVKAAKKEIRKNGSFTQVVDNFGHKHGYESDKAKELYNSRLVVRENAKGTKKIAKSRLKSFRGKENREGFNDPYFKGEGNKIRKQEIKRIKKNSKDTRKTSKKISKANRILAKI